MLTINEIRKKAEGYAEVHFGGKPMLFDPMFRKENNKFYLGFLVMEIVDEANCDWRNKRPTKWMLLDILTGDLVNVYDSHEYDYCDSKDYPLDLIIESGGESTLYEYVNYVGNSFFDWKNQLLNDIREKGRNTDNENHKYQAVLRIGQDNVNQKDLVLSNVETLLDEMYNEIYNKIGTKVEEAYRDYFEYTLDEVRKSYENNGKINEDEIIKYIELLKYTWPNDMDLINNFDNISTSRNEELEKSLNEQVKEQRSKYLDDIEKWHKNRENK